MTIPYVPKRPPLDPCPLESVVALIAGKWKARILYQLRLEPLRFAHLRRALGDVSQQVLSAQLQALRRDGLVQVETAEASGLLYRLTRDGEQLVEILTPASAWGLERLHRQGLTWARPNRVHAAASALSWDEAAN